MTWFDHTWRDIRHSARSIARMRGLALVVVVSLGVGIGVNTAIFSWLQAIFLKPIPGVADASSYHLVEARAETGTYPGMSWRDYEDLRARLRSFRDLVAFRMAPLNIGDAARLERATGMFVSGNYFRALGLTPVLGRFITPAEVERAGSEPVVVVSYDFWQTRMAGAPDAIGRRLRVNDADLTVVGIAPEGFQGTVLMLNFDLWMPATMAPALLAGSTELVDRNMRGYQVIGQLADGASSGTASTEVAGAMRELAQLYPASNATLTGEVRPFWRSPRGPQETFANMLAVLQGIMLLLLLAVCGNTANLLLARASARQHEVGVRLALGARRFRVVRLLLTESALLASMGALLGGALAFWATEALRNVPMTGAVPVKFQTSVDGVTLLFAFALGLVCALIFGLAPALQLARVDPQRTLHSGSRATSRGWLRGMLMGAQVALAVVVLAVAGMFLETFRETRDVDPGFQRDGVLLAAYDLGVRGPVETTTAATFVRTLLERLQATPGVEAAAVASNVPLDIHGLPLASFTLEGRARTDAGTDQALNYTVTPGYLGVLGIPIIAGSDFADMGDSAAPPQVIVNQAFVRDFIGSGEALGRRVRFGTREYVIAGVARDAKYESFSESPTPVIYQSYRDRPRRTGEIHLRARPGTETVLGSELRRVVRELDAALPLYNVRTMTDHVERNLVLQRIPARIFMVLGPMLLALAAIGIYAVVAYSVAQRTAEIGVRLALGASQQRVVRDIVFESFRTIAIGAAVGWVLAYGITRFPMIRTDFTEVLIAVPIILLGVAAASCWIPARRASGVDPVIALRAE